VADVVPNATELRPLLTESPYGSKVARSGGSRGPGGDTTNVGRRAVP
jgi:7,8-dihydro-6-hydroxymethylpterin dimethyltransferase